MIFKLNDFQRKLYADKSMDIGNLALAALIFSQLISGKFSFILTICGSIIYIVSYVVSYFLTRKLKE